MTEEIVSQIIVAVATLGASPGGYLLAGVNERSRDQRTFHREIQARASERASVRENETRSFQRETLLALQDAVQVMARLTGKALHFDHMQARQGQFTQLPDDLSDEMFANGTEVKRLMARVLDDEVRDAVDAFNAATIRLSLDPSYLEGHRDGPLERQALLRTTALNDAYAEISTLLGQKIRHEIAWRPNDEESHRGH